MNTALFRAWAEELVERVENIPDVVIQGDRSELLNLFVQQFIVAHRFERECVHLIACQLGTIIGRPFIGTEEMVAKRGRASREQFCDMLVDTVSGYVRKSKSS